MKCSFCEKDAVLETGTVRITDSFAQKMNVRALHYLLCREHWVDCFQVVEPQRTIILNGGYVHSANCNECKKFNRAYCPQCVD
jgi:hypothetical protein